MIDILAGARQARASAALNREMLRIKRVHTPELRDEVLALRYRAYRQEGAIPLSRTERFEDKYDHQPNHVLWAVTLEERVVGSIRTTWFDPATPDMKLPEHEAYADEVRCIASTHARLLSGNRFVTEPMRPDRETSLYAMLLLRHYMVVAHSKADYSLAAVRANHLPFYRRTMRLERA